MFSDALLRGDRPGLRYQDRGPEIREPFNQHRLRLEFRGQQLHQGDPAKTGLWGERLSATKL